VFRIHEFGIKGVKHAEQNNSSMAKKSKAELLTKTLAAAQKGGTSLNLGELMLTEIPVEVREFRHFVT
jgi:hypothetical protein